MIGIIVRELKSRTTGEQLNKNLSLPAHTGSERDLATIRGERRRLLETR